MTDLKACPHKWERKYSGTGSWKWECSECFSYGGSAEWIISPPPKPADLIPSNTRADQGGEAAAWLVESEKAGRVSSELHELSADKVIAEVEREYGDAYGATTKRPLFTHPSATADEVKDAARYRWLRGRIDPYDGTPFICIYHLNFGCWNGEHADREIDGAIDAALASKRGE